MDDKDDNVIDIESEETGRVTRGMNRREARQARARERIQARTGANGEKTSRILWIVVGSVIGVVVIRGIDRYFPRQVAALPPGALPVAAAGIEAVEV